MLKNQNAFTLIELLVTICVLGVLLSLAVPNFRSQIVNNRSTALAEDLTTRINQARYEAIKGAKTVTICASNNSTTVTPTCTGNWTDGYIVFEDATLPVTTNSITAVGTVLRAYSKHDAKSVIDVKNGSTAVTFMRFTATGTLARIANSANPLTINTYTTGCKGDSRRVISLGVSGMVSVQRVACPT
jgi:type IV fimbrial biogenesis protein FimT